MSGMCSFSDSDVGAAGVGEGLSPHRFCRKLRSDVNARGDGHPVGDSHAAIARVIGLCRCKTLRDLIRAVREIRAALNELQLLRARERARVTGIDYLHIVEWVLSGQPVPLDRCGEGGRGDEQAGRQVIGPDRRRLHDKQAGCGPRQRRRTLAFVRTRPGARHHLHSASPQFDLDVIASMVFDTPSGGELPESCTLARRVA